MSFNAVIDWHDAQIEELLNSVDGPVGQMIARMSEQATAQARRAVPVRKGYGVARRAPARSTAWAPGYTRSTIHVHGPVRGSRGGLYGGVNVSASPAIFLEYPASQMSHPYPFMSTALDFLSADI